MRIRDWERDGNGGVWVTWETADSAAMFHATPERLRSVAKVEARRPGSKWVPLLAGLADDQNGALATGDFLYPLDLLGQ